MTACQYPMAPGPLERDRMYQHKVSLVVRYFMIPCNICLILLATSTLVFAVVLFLNNYKPGNYFPPPPPLPQDALSWIRNPIMVPAIGQVGTLPIFARALNWLKSAWFHQSQKSWSRFGQLRIWPIDSHLSLFQKHGEGWNGLSEYGSYGVVVCRALGAEMFWADLLCYDKPSAQPWNKLGLVFYVRFSCWLNFVPGTGFYPVEAKKTLWVLNKLPCSFVPGSDDQVGQSTSSCSRVIQCRARGYFPKALVNYTCMIGVWAFVTDFSIPGSSREQQVQPLVFLHKNNRIGLSAGNSCTDPNGIHHPFTALQVPVAHAKRSSEADRAALNLDRPQYK
ncbi:Agrin [Chelonia mydas]|uniref:Agrin n=1 Tax=Chelonia mydas TaxID=8469 RepID=M7ASX0_CHEMY|nr:Agrin [Chelonia mydas]